MKTITTSFRKEEEGFFSFRVLKISFDATVLPNLPTSSMLFACKTCQLKQGPAPKGEVCPLCKNRLIITRGGLACTNSICGWLEALIGFYEDL